MVILINSARYFFVHVHFMDYISCLLATQDNHALSMIHADLKLIHDISCTTRNS